MHRQINIILSILTLLLTFSVIKVNCFCDTKFSVICEQVSDVDKYGKRDWLSLIIGKEDKFERGDPDQVLETGVFKNVENLESLSIISKLTDIKEGAFRELRDLKFLTLLANKLTVLKKGAFSGFKRLQKLDLQFNQIENINHETFEDSNIASINLANNKLTNLQVNQLNLPSLRSLNLANNEFYFFTPGCFHENLEELNLQSTNLKTMWPNVLSDIKYLKTLILSRNQIEIVEPIPELERLQTLDLSHNNISEIDFDAFESYTDLKNLYIGDNNISEIDEDLFSKNEKLKVLHIQKNKFTFLDSSVFETLHSLKEIAIGGNPFLCPCYSQLEKTMEKKKVSQPQCEKRYFRNGRRPFCLAALKNTCDHEEKLPDHIYQTFVQKVIDYRC